jgi:endonuclease III
MFRGIRAVARALRRRYGYQTLGNKKNPLNELLYIVLSSKTPPGRYQETYGALKKRFPRADDLAPVRPKDIASVIVRGGLAQKRAKQISAIARELRAQFGRVTLSPLARMSDPEAGAFLERLPGVGVKVARCILLFALDRKVFPVDAHCFRIVSRVGWTRNGATLTDRLAHKVQDGIPVDLRRQLHVSFVLLGREFCAPSSPRCSDCPIVTWCDTGKFRVAGHDKTS